MPKLGLCCVVRKETRMKVCHSYVPSLYLMPNSQPSRRSIGVKNGIKRFRLFARLQQGPVTVLRQDGERLFNIGDSIVKNGMKRFQLFARLAPNMKKRRPSSR